MSAIVRDILQPLSQLTAVHHVSKLAVSLLCGQINMLLLGPSMTQHVVIIIINSNDRCYYFINYLAPLSTHNRASIVNLELH